MGTNFEWRSPDGHTVLHIGKRSGAGNGQCSFSVQGHERDLDAPIVSWRQWTVLLRLPGAQIRDEYGRWQDPEAFIAEVEAVTIPNRRRQWEWLRDHYQEQFPGLPDDHVPEGQGPVPGDLRTWLDADQYSVTFREFG